MIEKQQQRINLLNASWRPALGVIIVLSTAFVYMVFPLLYMVFQGYGVHIELPKDIVENLNNLLITGGVLAGLRTIEKWGNVTTNH